MRMDWLNYRLAEIRNKGLYRKLNTIESGQTPRIIKDGKELILLSSNNYLGLTYHPEVRKAAIDAIAEYGTGSGGSRLTSGNTDLTGVLGKHCRGTADHFNVDVDINMGTLSKALASTGGYVAGSNELIEFLRNRARSFIFSTALPPPAAAAALAAIDIIEKEKPAIKLWDNITFYKKGLEYMGFSVQSETQIIPLMIGDSRRTLDAANELERLGVFALGIRPPAVPEGKGRIRTSLMASHCEKDIADALFAISVMKKKFNL